MAVAVLLTLASICVALPVTSRMLSTYNLVSADDGALREYQECDQK